MSHKNTGRINLKGLGTFKMFLLVEAEKHVVATEHVVVADNLMHAWYFLIYLVGQARDRCSVCTCWTNVVLLVFATI